LGPFGTGVRGYVGSSCSHHSARAGPCQCRLPHSASSLRCWAAGAADLHPELPDRPLLPVLIDLQALSELDGGAVENNEASHESTNIIMPWLSVTRAADAVEFYRVAFGATTGRSC